MSKTENDDTVEKYLKNFTDEVTKIFEEFRAAQQPLGHEFEKVWSVNIEDLYED